MSNVSPAIAARLARTGFKIDEVRTEHHELPGKGPSAQTPPNAPNLPPGHPLRAQDVHAQKGSVRPAEGVRSDIVQSQNAPQPSGPVVPIAETDPDYYSLTLLSLFKFYDRKFLSARMIKGKHQAKFNKASKEQNLRYLVEAISSTLGDGASAFDLTPSDFYYLMYWQRISSFPKNPQIIRATCDNKNHVRRTLLKADHEEFLAPETLQIELFLDKTTVEEDYLDELSLEPFAELIAKYDLHVETMRDLVEYAELEEEVRLQKAKPKKTTEELAQESIDEDELDWLSGRAAFLRRTEGRTTLRERIAIVNEMDADEIQELENYIDAVTAYGVREHANVKCKECGAHHRVPISIDALNFLPSNR